MPDLFFQLHGKSSKGIVKAQTTSQAAFKLDYKNRPKNLDNLGSLSHTAHITAQYLVPK